MKSFCLRVQRIIDFGALVSVVGVDNDTAAPVTVHVDYEPSMAFWRAWRAADCAQPIEYVADRLLLQLDMVPNGDIADAPDVECDDLPTAGTHKNQTPALEIEP